MIGGKRKHVSIFGDVEESESPETSSQVTIPTIETEEHGESNEQRSSKGRTPPIQSPGSVLSSSSELESSSDEEYIEVTANAELRAYRELMENLSALESSNLTRQLISHYKKTGRSNMTFVSPYVAWPVEPDVVPRSSSQIWPDSILSQSNWRPSAELEETIFAVMLRQARSQWDQRRDEIEEEGDGDEDEDEAQSDHLTSQDQSERHTTDLTRSEIRGTKRRALSEASERLSIAASSDPIKASSEISSSAGSSSLPNTSERQSSSIQTATEASTVRPSYSQIDYPVFSADDDRSFKILKPSVQNVLSSVDQVLIGLHKSNNRAPQRRRAKVSDLEDLSIKAQATSREDIVDEPREKQERWKFRLRDWSHVVGVAANVGLPADVISRVAVRCAATFGESMQFAILQEDQTNEAPELVTVNPEDFHDSSNANNKLVREPEPFVWEKEDGCPFQECRLYGKRALSPKAKKDVSSHIRKVHGWVLGDGIEKLEELVRDSLSTEYGNGVHLNGYMRQIRSKGWHTKPRKPGKSSRKIAPAIDDEEESGRDTAREISGEHFQSGLEDRMEDVHEEARKGAIPSRPSKLSK